MADHSLGEVHAQVVEIKKKLESGGGIATQAFINEKFKENSNGGVTKEYMDEKFKSAKEDPTQAEQWAKVIGADAIVKAFQDFKLTSITSLSAMGAILAGLVVGAVVEKDLLTVSILRSMGFKRDEKGIPRRMSSGDAVAQQAPVSSVDVDRLKSMRSSSIALSRSLSDLTKEVSRAAQQIA
jgi:hypothetical protein